MNEYPELPPELGITDPEILTELPELWREVCEELLVPMWRRRSHLHRKTYESGCRGPLCRKANRDFVYRTSEEEFIPRNKARRFDTVLMFFMVEAQHRIEEEEARMLEKILAS